MVWLVLQSPSMPQIVRLHSEETWNAMAPRERVWWDIVKRCETRDEANAVLDALKAEMAKTGIPKRRRNR
jgi:hypothetical protein